MKKTIVVVGAGKGLGNGVAEKFGNKDFRVILMARSEEHLKKYAADFAAKGIEVYTQAADVADFDAFAQTFGEVVKTYGTPDVAVLQCGYYHSRFRSEDGHANADGSVCGGCCRCIQLYQVGGYRGICSEERGGSRDRRRSCASALCGLYAAFHG